MAYGGFKDLPRRTASDELLPCKALTLLKLRNMIDINVHLFQRFINLCIESPLFLLINLLLVLLKKGLCQNEN